MGNKSWPPIIKEAKRIVNDDYNYLITLRQLHYLLYMSTKGLGYRNNKSDYSRLSELTAEGRRDIDENGEQLFPDLLDQTREIYRASSWTSPQAAVEWLAGYYQRNRAATQPYYIALAGEKATLLAQLNDWFSDRGLPIILTRGYGSQTYVDDVRRMVERERKRRPTVLIYAGDLDPSGMDILRDFQERCPVWDEIIQVAVNIEQVERTRGLVRRFLALAKITEVDQPSKFRHPMTHKNPRLRGQYKDSRAPTFKARYGLVFQTEVEAIEPDTLRRLYTEALDRYWDQGAYELALAQEEIDKERLQEIATELGDDEDE